MAVPLKGKIILACPRHATFTQPLKKALEAYGFDVFLFDYGNIMGNLRFNLLYFFFLTIQAIVSAKTFSKLHILNTMLYLLCKKRTPRYLWVIKGEHVWAETIDQVKKLGTTTLVWQVDTVFHPRIWPFVSQHNRAYDIFIACEPDKTVQILKKRGFKHVLYMLGAADSFNMQFAQNHPKKYDITLIGTYHPLREKFLVALKDLDLHIWGWGKWHTSRVASSFEGKAVTQKEMLNIYKQSKIVLNIGRSSKSTSPTNLRPFEAAQVGAFILVDYKKNLHRVFKLGKEIDTFKTPEELRQKVNYYLGAPVRRKAIAKSMFDRIKHDHTYEARVRSLFADVAKLGY